MPSPDEMYECIFNAEKKDRKAYDLQKYTDDNTSLATYVWLPIRFDKDGRPYIEWEDEWEIDVRKIP